jgi:hypothetical protein
MKYVVGHVSQKTVHCPWCGKTVQVYKGRLRSHLEGAQKCVGVGQPLDVVRAANANVKGDE